MRTRPFFTVVGVLLLLAGGGFAWMWYAGWFDTSVRGASAETNETTPAETGDLQEALQLAKSAQAKLHALGGYRCVYLRDERIDNELQQNYLKLSVRHEPFSVLMEWVEPRSKKGRKVAYVAGKNDGKMRVKIGLIPALSMDPQESIKRKESRHTIPEAGMKNMADRLVQSWQQESQTGETTVRYSDAEVGVELGGKHHKYSCRLVETVHPAETRGKYDFCKTKVYFDKATGYPVRMEGYDWPGAGNSEGILLERYSYVEMNTEGVPPGSEFQL